MSYLFNNYVVLEFMFLGIVIILVGFRLNYLREYIILETIRLKYSTSIELLPLT